MRNRSLRRVLLLLRTLQGGGRYTFRELGLMYGVHHRTIRRDVEVLQEVGYAVCRAPDSDAGKFGTWWIDKSAPSAQEGISA